MLMTEITSRLSTALADRYQIVRHLGEGCVGTSSEHSHVALQVIPCTGIFESTFRK
jgi:hypothetical protein